MSFTFLPIVQHELRAAARRRSTVLARCISAAFALAGAVFYVLTDPTVSNSAALFRTMSLFSAGICCIMPMVLASDCISEERRHGTLGLLLLTDLKGHDIVIGKLIGVSLNAGYCLLGVLPALALPLLFGGIVPGEFCRMSVALLNLMFFSFAVSICCSCFFKHARASFALAVVTMLGLCAALSVLSASPAQAVYRAFESHYVGASAAFWLALVASMVVGLLALMVAGIKLPKAFQREAIGGATARLMRARLRDRAMLDQSPIQWLIMDSPFWPTSVWLVAIALVAALVFAAALPARNPLVGVIGWPIAGALVLFKLLFAQQSSRFFAEARRNGALEALCSTPVDTEEFIRSQWRALRNVFLAPAVLLLLFYFIALHTQAFAPMLSLQARTSFVGLNVPLLAIYLVALFVFDLFAIGWFSMWLGFSLPRPQYAVVFALLVGVVVPAVIIVFPHPLITLAMLVNGRTRLRQHFRTGHFVPAQV